MVEQGRVIELNHDKLYIVVSTAVVDGKKYLYLIGYDDKNDIKFCIEEQTAEGIDIIELGDDEDITEIVKILYEKGMEDAKNLPEDTNQAE